MIRIFLRHSLRYFSRHRTLTLLNVWGIALGVAVFISVQTVNYSALQSFRASVDLVAGRAQLEVAGDNERIDENIYTTVRDFPGIAAATPVVETVCLIPHFPGEYLQIVGIDLFSNEPFRTYQITANEKDSASSLDFIKQPRAIALTQKLARRLGVKLGESIILSTPTGPQPFTVGFLIEFNDDTPGADEHIAAMDIANVQQTFRLSGKLSRIDLRLQPGFDAAQVAEKLKLILPTSVLVQTPDRRSHQVEKMVGSFQLNLTALSLISLLVGMFLIYNTVATGVVRRRTEIGILRSLGLTPRQVQGLFLGEALLLGTIGLLLGIVLGVALASQLVGLASHNLTSLYILLSIQHIFVSPWSIAAAVVLALGAVLLATWHPAWEASQVRPVEALSFGHLRSKSVRHAPLWLGVGLILVAIAAVFDWVSLRFGPAWLSFLCALLTLLGFSLFVPQASLCFVRLIKFRHPPFRVGVDHFRDSLHRNSITIAALVTALAMLVGISVMIFSFRKTVETWLSRSVTADVFIAPASSLILGHREVLRPEVENIARQTPGLLAYDSYRETRIRFRDDTVKMAAIHFDIVARFNSFQFMEGDSHLVFPEAARHDEVVVNESFSRKFHVQTGDSLPLNTPQGIHAFRVAAVFYDYTTEFGLILMDQGTYRKFWRDDSINSLALYAQPGVTAASMQGWLRGQLSGLGEFLIYSNQDLRREVFRIFDQTFAITYVLQTIGLVISGLGIFLNLTILVAERQREMGILRAIGASRGQIMQIVLTEAALLAGVGSILGIAAGLSLAWILSNVINVAFYGWTIQWATPWDFLLGLIPAIMVTALFAGYWPARRAAEINIAQAVKAE